MMTRLIFYLSGLARILHGELLAAVNEKELQLDEKELQQLQVR